MINKDFYPTPKPLIATMLQDIDLREMKYILEPSAGKGDICDYIKEKAYFKSDNDIDVIEIEPDLQTILKEKEYNLVFDNFLSFNTNKVYDLIIANFPFSDGDLHLQKALSLIEKNGGTLICLVNAETIKNPYTNLRQILVQKLNEYKASIEYLADQFTDAERKTNVEVALIRLAIEKGTEESLLLANLKKAEVTKVEDEYEQKSLVDNNFIKALIIRFELECKIGLKLIDEYLSLKPYLMDKIERNGQEPEYSATIIDLRIKGTSAYGNSTKKEYVNCYLSEMRKKYWELFIQNPRFYSKYTTNILSELDRKLTELKDYDFNEFNIKSLMTEMNLKIVKGIEDSIIKLFEELSCKFHYNDEYSQNVHYFNGWKTNKGYRINHKVILPINGFSSWNKEQIDYHYINGRISDMVKIFNYLGQELKDVPQLVGNSLRLAENVGNCKTIDMHYFDVTFYKKGTCHIRFKNKELLDKFNIFGSQRKGWLPPSYGKKHYSEMTKEERNVVDEFQGEEEYEQVMIAPENYIIESKQLLLSYN